MKRIAYNRAEELECRLEHRPEFLRRVAEARADLAAGRGIPFHAPKRRARRKKRH